MKNKKYWDGYYTCYTGIAYDIYNTYYKLK